MISSPDFKPVGSLWIVGREASHRVAQTVAIDNYHTFSRDRVILLLRESGFEILDFAVPDPFGARMELYAVRRSV